MKTLAPIGANAHGQQQAQQQQPLRWRLQQWLLNYLPLALMALLAAATTWLVRQAPDSAGPQVAVAPRSTPDYEMRGFELQRFNADGGTQAWLRGEALRHYPDDDRLEFDGLRIELQGEDGSWLHAESRQAVGPQDGSRLRMSGLVLVRRYAPGADPARSLPVMELQTTELIAERDGSRLSSRAATQVRTPTATVQVAGFDYEHGSGLLRFKGPSRSVLQGVSGMSGGPR